MIESRNVHKRETGLMYANKNEYFKSVRTLQNSAFCYRSLDVILWTHINREAHITWANGYLKIHI